MGWEGGRVLKKELSTSASCINICAEHPLQRQKTTLVPYILHTFTCFTCSIIFFPIAVCLCRSGAQRRSCCTTRGASLMTSSTSQSKKEAHGLLVLHVAGKRTDDISNQTALTDVNMDVLRSRRIRITWFSVVVLKGKIDPCAVFFPRCQPLRNESNYD